MTTVAGVPAKHPQINVLRRNGAKNPPCFESGKWHVLC